MGEMGFKITEIFIILAVISCVVLVMLCGLLYWMFARFNAKWDEFTVLAAGEVKRIETVSDNARQDIKNDVASYETNTFKKLNEIVEKCKSCKESIEARLASTGNLLKTDAKEISELIDRTRDLENQVKGISSKVNLLDIEHET